jgi:hypothetical protein
MAIQHDLEPREPSGPETTFPKLPFCSPEPKYCGTFPEPTAKATRCGWTTTCITTCYRFLRRALLCRSKGNKTLAPTKNVDAKKNDTRTCANMNCERHALDEKCSKYPDTLLHSNAVAAKNVTNMLSSTELWRVRPSSQYGR